MKDVNSIQLKRNSNEELLGGFSYHFPYIASRAYLNQYRVTWHWHKAAELFYMEKGSLEYMTPNGKFIIPEGSGGFVNTGVLHMSKPQNGSANTIQLLHIFDTSFLAGYAGSLIETKYISPLTTSSVEFLPIFEGTELCDKILDELRRSFELSDKDYGYEIKLRDILSKIWLQILELPVPGGVKSVAGDSKLKIMMEYIYNNYADKIRVSDIAASAFIGERECYRVFNQTLHITPNEYLTEYRISEASRLLAQSEERITDIALMCGFGSSSIFGKVFKTKTGYTPVEYRKKLTEF